MKLKLAANRPQAAIAPVAQNRNKIIIISAISIILVLGLVFFLVNKQFVGKAITGADYNVNLLSASGSAGIPIVEAATAGLNEQNNLVVGANIGSGDGLAFSFTFTYDPALITFNGLKEGITYTLPEPDGRAVKIPAGVVVATPISNEKIKVTGALLPSKTLKEYVIKDYDSDPATTIVPLVVLDINTLSKEGTATIHFTDFTVLDENSENLINSSKVFDTTFKIAAAPVPCTPSCAGKNCGDDGCGGSCGSCATDQTCEVDTCRDYVCTGDAPLNAALCSGDDSGLTADTPNKAVADCTDTKCEYTCNVRFELKNGACVVIPPKILGDVDGKDGVNVLDIMKIINHITEITVLVENEKLNADTNCDSNIDVLDIMKIITAITEDTTITCPSGG